MPGAATLAGSTRGAPPVADQAAASPTSGGIVPFFFGSNWYVEKFNTVTRTLDTTAPESSFNINPGGFMRGVRVEVSATGGALGGGALNGDAPFSVFTSMTLENIDGSPIVYPMRGYSHYIAQTYFRPWMGDVARRGDYSATVNPSFTLFLQPEIRHTAGALANTDARALYRVRFTWSTLAAYVVGGAPTGPSVTVTLYLETWAQPDAADLRGNQIAPVPPGLALVTLRRRQIINLAAVGADNTFQMSNMGNELRGIALLTRNSSDVRTDLLSDPIRWRIDNRSLGTMSPRECRTRMYDFYYDNLATGGTIPTGLYVFPRFLRPGDLFGEPWLATTNATYLIYESQTAAGGAGGTAEFITDEVIPVAPVPLELESI